MLADGHLGGRPAAPWGVLAKHGGGTLVRAVKCAVMLVAMTLASLAVGPLAVPAQADPVVSPVPGKTPAVLNGQVYALTKIGNTVVAGGNFSSARSWGSGATAQDRSNILAFDATTGALVSGFAPTLDGPVQTLIPGPTPGTVLVAGGFKKLNGKSVQRVVLINLANGARVTSFKAAAPNGKVWSMAAHDNRLYIGGNFTTVGGVAHSGFASLDFTTGALDPFVNVQLTQRHNDSGSGAKSAVGITKLDVTPDGSRVVAIGNFKRADGLLRDQVVMVDTDGASAVVAPDWATARYSPYCGKNSFDSWVRDVSFSPDGSFFVIAASGGPYSGTLCDAAARWETGAVGTDLQPTWVNWSGGDTLWGVEVTDSAVYVGGHMRWMNNINGRDSAGQGAVPRPGIAALSVHSGIPLDWNPGRHPRGEAAYTFLATDNGLYFGSNSAWIGNFTYQRPRLGFFPLAGGHEVADDSLASLPAEVLVGSPNNSGDSLSTQSFNGGAFGPRTSVDNGGITWSKVRGAFWAGGKLFYGYDDGFLYSRTYRKGTFGPAVKLDPYRSDPTWTGVATGSGSSVYTGNLPSMFASLNSSVTGLAYHDHRLYYTQSNSSSLQWRYFDTDSGIVGSEVFSAANGIAWNDAALAFASDDQLFYVQRSTGQLRKVSLVNHAPSGSATTVDTSRDWRGRAVFLAPANVNEPPVADFTATCVELSCDLDGSVSTDPDGSVATYQWSIGGTGATAHQDFAAAGGHQVTLTVTDNEGASDSVTKTVTAVAPAASDISFVGAGTYAGTAASAAPSVTVPSGVQAGDTLVLYGSFGLEGAAPATPSGWTEVGSRTHTGMSSKVWVTTATAGSSGSTVTVSLGSSTKSALTLAAYRGASAAVPAPAIASSVDSSATAHVAPTVTASSGAWLLSYWSDKSSWTTAWSTPAGTTERGTALGTGSGRITSVLVDSGQKVPTPGTWGGERATVARASNRGINWTVALSPAP